MRLLLCRRTNSRFVQGVRLVAIFEALKGLIVLVSGFGLLAFIHRDLQSVAEDIVRQLHLNPARHYPRIFIEASATFSDTRLWSIAALAFLYAAVRFTEAYGLWRMRSWAEWFAIVSGGIYLPIELFDLYERATWVRGLVLLANGVLVAYLVYARVVHRHSAGGHGS